MTQVRTLAKEEVDWNAVYAELLPKVYNYFRYRLGDGPGAEDLTAITFEKAWGKRHQYRQTKPPFQPGCIPSPDVSPSITTAASRLKGPCAAGDGGKHFKRPGVEQQVLARQDQDYLIITDGRSSPA
jgi:hypothetical protein